MAMRAARLGWGAAALLGMNPSNPLTKVHELGLLWHVQGGAIVEIDSGGALIERNLG